jgi:hypothetical protein
MASARAWVICVNAIPASRYRLIRGFWAIWSGYDSTADDESERRTTRGSAAAPYARRRAPAEGRQPDEPHAVVTLALIVACVAAWTMWQQEPQRSPTDDLVFNLENAAIPCELTEGRPLTVPELEATFGRLGGDPRRAASAGSDAPVGVPDKSVWLVGVRRRCSCTAA